MLSGLKFIPRDEVERSRDEGKEGSRKERKKSKSSRRDKGKHKKRSSYDSSDEDLDRIKSGSRKKSKWYSEDESSSNSDGSDDGSDSEHGVKDRKRRKDKKRAGSAKKKKRSRGKDSSEEYSSSRGDRSEIRKLNDDSRKAMGLDFMLRPKDAVEKAVPAPLDDPSEFQSETKEVKANPRELNPYFKDNGSGYPEESDGKTDGKQLLSPKVIGDGGASWRLKALKRAQEQAAREGRNFDEVVQERWGSVGELAVSAAAHKVAPAHAHIHAIKNRRRGTKEDEQTFLENIRHRLWLLIWPM